MATADSVKNKIEGLISQANEATGKEDTDLTAAVGSLIAGIQAGGGDYSAEYLASIMDRTVKNLVIPEGMTQLGYYAFAGCNQLESVQFPDSLQELGDDCFYAVRTASMLDITLPPHLVTINSGAFYGAIKLRVSRIPDSVVTIGSTAFRESACAVSEIPSGVKTIGANAFNKCASSSITFHGTPESIGTNAFANNRGLTTINVPWAEGEVANAPWGATNATINYNYTGG